MEEVWIVSACRTAIGKFGGALANEHVSDLGCTVIKGVIERSGIAPHYIDEVIMGHAIHAGTGQGATRLAAVKAGIPESVSSFSINNVCGSGLKAINIASILISSGENSVIIAGGMENMSLSPFVLKGMRFRKKLGNEVLEDILLTDALTDPFEHYHMGITAENIARIYDISREQQDQYSVISQNRAEKAVEAGRFIDEIVSINVSATNGKFAFNVDEYYRRNVTIESIASLKPAFLKNGTVTAANSAGINDGAAAILLASSKAIDTFGLIPIAKIVAQASVGIDHKIMGMGSATSITKVLEKAQLKIENIDRFEINEAFASQVLAAKMELGIDINKLNVNGGAIALGHPIGASGARILVTLINELLRCNGKYGIASICVGGGMGIAILIEMARPYCV